MTMMRARHHGGADDEIEVIEPTPEEYEKAVQASLDDLGLTYRQLVRQAKKGEFSSLRARKLWLLIGRRRDHDD